MLNIIDWFSVGSICEVFCGGRIIKNFQFVTETPVGILSYSVEYLIEITTILPIHF